MTLLDLRGLKCPLPVLKTEKRLAALTAGDELTVLADDPLAKLDLQHMCNSGGHALLACTALTQGGWQFIIRRG